MAKMDNVLEKQVKHLDRIESLAKTDRLIQLGQLAYEKKLDDDEKHDSSLIVRSLDAVTKAVSEVSNRLSDTGAIAKRVFQLGETIKSSVGGKSLSPEQAKGVTDASMKGQTYFKTMGDRMSGMKEGAKNFFTMRGFLDKTGIVTKGSGGILDNAMARREAKQQYISDRMKMEVGAGRMEDTKENRKAFGAQFERQQKTLGGMHKNEKEISRLQEAGYSDKDIGNAGLLGKREQLAKQMMKDDPRARRVAKELEAEDEKKPKIVGKSGASESRAGKNASSGLGAADMTEADMENQKRLDQQIELLTKIEENTAPQMDKKSGAKESSAGSDSGIGSGIGGFLKGVAGGIGALGTGIAKLGRGLASLGASLGRGIAGLLQGVATGLAAMANPATLLGLGAVTIAVIGIGKAMELAAPFMEAFAPVLIKIADVVQNVFVAAIEKIPEVIKAVGDVIMGVITTISDSIVKVIDAVTNSIKELANIDGENLLKVGAGLAAVAAGMVAFGAGQAVTGVTNLVSGLLSKVTGQKTPVEQVMELGKSGEGISKAGEGVKNLGEGLSTLTKVDPEKLKIISSMPAEKIVAMGTAMGKAMPQPVQKTSGTEVAAASSDAEMAKSKQPASAPVVIAPQTNVSNNSAATYAIKSPVRNPSPPLPRNRYAVA